MNVKLRHLAFPAFLLLFACGGSMPPPEAARPLPDAKPAAGTNAEPRSIEVPLLARSGSHLSGQATFTNVAEGVKVTVLVAGAPPGPLATHVHEKGDCSAPDAKSAGEHFNPTQKQHGVPPDVERHVGDLGNIEIKADGTGATEVVVKGASLQAGDTNSFLGRAIIVHEKQDDGAQPSGNAGGRIGCGVITK
jgi:superoxide dismutase, Cu-Zn family